jgi:hypothetical protein
MKGRGNRMMRKVFEPNAKLQQANLFNGTNINSTHFSFLVHFVML